MTPRSTHTILVVDDAQANRYALARGLRAQGFATLEAASGEEALALAPGASGVVLDVHLPDVHGMEVCRKLRADPRTAHLPIVHVSAVYITRHHRVQGELAGADEYLVSPVDSLSLARTLDGLIAQRVE